MRGARAVLVWLGVFAILGGFVYLQHRHGCAFLARGGSVLVMYGVLMGYLSARHRMRYGELLDAIQSEQVLLAQLLHFEDQNPDKTQYSTALIEQKLEGLSKRLAELQKASRRFFGLRYVELPILLIGTALWGFGDLIEFGPAGCSIGL